MKSCEWAERIEGWTPQTGDARGWDDADYARVVHSGSFRRLQGKTQILNLGDSDFYRTRLTHSLEVAQIAGSITRQLKSVHKDGPIGEVLPSTSLIQAIGFTHDLGHPPFGHGGEVALNYCMRSREGLPVSQSGFEGNGQTLRILARLEKFSKSSGANLARRTLLGVLKYPTPFSSVYNPDIVPILSESACTLSLINRKNSKPPKCYLDCEQGVVDWILSPLCASDKEQFTSYEAVTGKHHKPIHKSLDCSIMDIADDVAFGVHDLEDSVALGLIREEEFRENVRESACSSYLDFLSEKYPGESRNNVYDGFVRMLFGDGRSRKHAISRLVGHFVLAARIDTYDLFQEPLLRYRAALREDVRVFLEALKGVVREKVILSPSVQHLEFKGQRMVVSVFEAIATEPKAFLPRDIVALMNDAESHLRVVCDYISGMTDAYLLKTYERLFSPRFGSVFDKL